MVGGLKVGGLEGWEGERVKGVRVRGDGEGERG